MNWAKLNSITGDQTITLTCEEVWDILAHVQELEGQIASLEGERSSLNCQLEEAAIEIAEQKETIFQLK